MSGRRVRSKEACMSVSLSAWLRLAWSSAAALLVAAAGTAFAVDPVNVVQVEEDWELVITDPDSGNTAPQVTCTISPYPQLDDLHSVVEINHKTVPYWAPGGIHLQTWQGETNLTRKSIESDASLSHEGESIAWTTRMKLTNNALAFSILNGTSTTWGNFGGGTTLHSSYASSIANLDAYSPDFSIENSGVGFASNRVASLVLKRVRYTLGNGDVVTDDTPRAVYQAAQESE
jgi:hypothetical protein